jgi:DNA-binding Lrp family transcriptional regulator
VSQKTIVLDRLDHQLLHALQLDGRLPFARFAQLTDVSEQTVARRYRRLRAAGVVRVLGLIDPVPLGESGWIVRIQSRPDSTVALADALARRPDVGWVSLVSGGTEILCVARSRTSRQRDELLLRRLPKTAEVTSFGAQAMMFRFEAPASWVPGFDGLAPDQVESVIAQAIGGGVRSGDTRFHLKPVSPDPPVLTDEDDRMLLELAADGRAPIVRLAEVTGWTPARVQRRLEELVGSGVLYFDADLAMEALGFRAMAFLWMTVSSAELHATGTALAAHDEVVFVAATTGVSNLVASVVCRDMAHLYRYVTESLGAQTAVRQLEVSPFLRRIKQGGSMMDGGRLVPGVLTPQGLS